jgi:hypothetical protein
LNESSKPEAESCNAPTCLRTRSSDRWSSRQLPAFLTKPVERRRAPRRHMSVKPTRSRPPRAEKSGAWRIRVRA